MHFFCGCLKQLHPGRQRSLQNKQIPLALAIHQVLTNPPQINQMLVSFPVLKKDALSVTNGSPHFKDTWTVVNITLLLRTRVSSTERSLVISRDSMCSQSGSVPNIPTEVSKVRSVENLLLPTGWALRSSQVKRTRFTANQKDY